MWRQPRTRRVEKFAEALAGVDPSHQQQVAAEWRRRGQGRGAQARVVDQVMDHAAARQVGSGNRAQELTA
jgi:hypothetical protein